MRVIEYEVTNRDGKGEIFCLITTIMDPEDASAAELAAAYQERWEFESSLDEIKTHQRGRGGVLRSKSPEMIRQEIWAFLLTHYAIRHLMCEAADQAGKDPDRLSFMRSLRVIRRQVTDQAALSPLPAEERTRRDFRRNPRKTQPAPPESQQPASRQTRTRPRLPGETLQRYHNAVSHAPNIHILAVA